MTTCWRRIRTGFLLAAVHSSSEAQDKLHWEVRRQARPAALLRCSFLPFPPRPVSPCTSAGFSFGASARPRQGTHMNWTCDGPTIGVSLAAPKSKFLARPSGRSCDVLVRTVACWPDAEYEYQYVYLWSTRQMAPSDEGQTNSRDSLRFKDGNSEFLPKKTRHSTVISPCERGCRFGWNDEARSSYRSTTMAG
jgi:hypothetical protein